MENLNDLDLITNIKQEISTDESLRELCNRHAGICEKMIIRSFDLRDFDIAKEKFLLVWKAALSFDEKRNVKFVTHLANQVRYFSLASYFNSKKKEDKFLNFVDKCGEDYLYETGGESKELLLQAIEKHCENISNPRTKKIFEQRYFAGQKMKTWREIGKEVGLSVQGCIDVHDREINFIKNKLKNYETNSVFPN